MGITKDQLNSERQERDQLVTPKIEKPKPNKIHDDAAPIEFCEAKTAFPLESKPVKSFGGY